MSSAGLKRISIGAFVGVAAASAVALVGVAIREGRVDRAVDAAGALLVATPVMWLVCFAFVLIASRLTREVSFLHTAIWAVALYIGVQIAALSTTVHGGASSEITGTPCNGGTGRRVAISADNARPGGPIYWSCVSLSEFEEMRASGALATPPERNAIPFERMLQAIDNRQVLPKGLLLGCIAAVAGWLYTFGRRWHANLDEI